MKKKTIKPQFRVGQRVRLVPRSEFSKSLGKFLARYSGVYGIGEGTYDRAARKIQVVGAYYGLRRKPICGSYGLAGSVFSWPESCIRAIKPAKRKAKRNSFVSSDYSQAPGLKGDGSTKSLRVKA